MAPSTIQLEQKFNESLPKITQTEKLSAMKPVKFDRERFLKSAEILRKTVKENDARELAAS